MIVIKKKIISAVISGSLALSLMPTWGIAAETEKNIYYVSPDGNDDALGTADAPLKTLGGAKEKIRAAKKAGKSGFEVIIKGGEYRVNATEKFTEDDSGTEENPIVYRAMEGEEVIFKGSVEIENPKIMQVTEPDVLERIKEKVRKKIVKIDLNGAVDEKDLRDNSEFAATIEKLKNGETNHLYIDGVSQTLAEWPNGDGIYTYWTVTEDGRTISYSESEPSAWVNAKDWWIGGYQDYDFRYSRIGGVGVDPVKRTITVSNLNANFKFTSYQSRRWKAFNLLEEIDLPGEFYVDREDMALYLYPPYTLKNARMEFSVLDESFIDIMGASHITFKGITFSQTRNDAVTMKDVRNIDFYGCTFKDVAAMGIFVTGSKKAITDANYWQYQQIDGSYDCDIKNCRFYNIGSSAIDISGGNVDTLEPSNNVIENNIFYMCSQIIKNKNAVSVKGCGTDFVHNNMSRCSYQGVYLMGNDHDIMYNEIHDVIQESDDCGAIYDGRNSIMRGNVMAYNYLHDLFSTEVLPFGHQTAIYWDDSQCGQTAYNNIINGVRKNIYTNGIDNVFKDNTSINITAGVMDIKNGGAAQNTTASVVGFGSVIADPELYYSKYKNLKEIIKLMEKGHTNPELSKFNVVTGNLDVNSADIILGSYTMEYGTVSNNVSLDSCEDFVDPENQDFRIKSGSDTAKLLPGLLDDSFDIERIGVKDDLDLNSETAPFKLLYPANGEEAVATSELEFKWENAVGASKYRLVIARDRALTDIVYDDISHYNVKMVEGLDKNTVYYWQVYAINRSREMNAEWKSISPVYTFSTAIYERLNTNYFNTIAEETEKQAETIVEGEKPGEYPTGTKEQLKKLIERSYVVANSRLGMFSQKSFDALADRIGTFFNSKGMVNKGGLDFGDFIEKPESWNGDYETEGKEIILRGNAERPSRTSMTGINGIERMTGSVVFCFDAKFKIDSGFVAIGLNKYTDAVPYSAANAGYSLVIKPDVIELQRSTGTEHAILTTVNYAVGSDYRKIEYGAIDIGIGNIIVLNIDGEAVIKYCDVAKSAVNSLYNFCMLVYNDTENSITLRRTEKVMDDNSFKKHVTDNTYESAKVLINAIDSGYNVREPFVILKKNAKHILTEKMVVDVSETPTAVENSKFMVPVERIKDILDAEVEKSGENYIIRYNGKEHILTPDKCKETPGGAVTPLEDVLNGLERGYVTDATDLLVVGNLVTMNNILVLSNASYLIDRIDEIPDINDYIFKEE